MSDSGEMQEFQGVGVDEAPPKQLPAHSGEALSGELRALPGHALPDPSPTAEEEAALGQSPAYFKEAPPGESPVAANFVAAEAASLDPAGEARPEQSEEALSGQLLSPGSEAAPEPFLPRDETLSGESPLAAGVPSVDTSAPSEDEPPPDESPAPTDEIRARMLRQFEQWLDAMLADEVEPPLPRELIDEALAETATAPPQSKEPDLLTLFSALTGLTGEIKLQGRAFKALTEALSPLARLPDQIEDMESAQADSTRQIERLSRQLEPDDAGESALPPPKEILTVLFDLLERLERGLKTFEAGIASLSAAKPHGLLARLSGGARGHAGTLATVQAMLEGYRLTASRLEAAVQQWGIQRIGKAGEMFDPVTMTAVEVDTAAGQPTGTVVEVYRSGYVLHGQMLAVTQVKVAK